MRHRAFSFKRVVIGVLVGVVLLTLVPYLWFSQYPHVRGTPAQRAQFHSIHSYLRGLGADFGPVFAEYKCLPEEEEPPQGRHVAYPGGVSHIIICDEDPITVAHELGHAVAEHLTEARKQELLDSMPQMPNWEWTWYDIEESVAVDFSNTIITGTPWQLAALVLDPLPEGHIPCPYPGLKQLDDGSWVVDVDAPVNHECHQAGGSLSYHQSPLPAWPFFCFGC